MIGKNITLSVTFFGPASFPMAAGTWCICSIMPEADRALSFHEPAGFGVDRLRWR